jgi:cytolysin-activating lysine-acyltransferase
MAVSRILGLEETERRFEGTGGRLKPDKWRKGDRCRVVELIAPFGGVDALSDALKPDALKERKVKLHLIVAEGIKADWL